VKSTLSSGTAHIEVLGLRRGYGTGEGAFEAVRGIDLVVEAGTIVAMLGTNGAGKTSALEVVEGLARPTAGRFACSVWTRSPTVRKCREEQACCCRRAGSRRT